MAGPAGDAAQAIARHAPATRALYVCGGGALNAYLMQRIAALLPGVAVGSTADRGLPPLEGADEAVLERVRKQVAVICKKFPVYGA